MTALLILIYIAFISLGIPDSLLGSVWPAMHEDLDVAVSMAGFAGMVVCLGTVFSGLWSARVIARFGTARVTAVSVLMTALALLGISVVRSFPLMLLLCIPLGLGGGAIDAALNNFVATHYHARHMNWLHCFWGIGATAGPAIISAILATTGNWRSGYISIGAFQCLLSAILFLTIPLWQAAGERQGAPKEQDIVPMKLREVVRLSLAPPVLLALLAYCGVENTMNLWGASYLVEARGMGADVSASWVSLFFLGITLGRLAAGFAAQKLRADQLVRIGICLSALGALLLLLPIGTWYLPIAYFLIGTGFAPIYPSMLHQTPRIFGGAISQSVMGVQMACAYVGSTFLPPLFGMLSRLLGMGFLPVYVLICVAAMLMCTRYVDGKLKGRDEKQPL